MSSVTSSNPDPINGSVLLKSAPKLFLLRHGESVWNQLNLFTAWCDVPLSQAGIQEALDTGGIFSRIPIDVIYTSQLIRAKTTTMLIMANHSSGKTPVIVADSDDLVDGDRESWLPGAVQTDTIPVYCAWQLNAQCSGELQGFNKDDCRRKWGAEQVRIWRRSYTTPPPQGESLEMTAKRIVPYFCQNILPHMFDDKRNCMVVAHGSTLRAILLYLNGTLDKSGHGRPENEFVDLEFENSKPICFALLAGKFVEYSVDTVKELYGL